MHGSFHRYFHALRLPALAVLMLAVLVNPVFAALGDLHESGQTQAGHLHDVDEHEAGVALEEQDGDGDLLHALMHASHCCGHLTGIVASVSLLDLPLSTTAAPAHASLAPRLQRTGNPFRPPITV